MTDSPLLTLDGLGFRRGDRVLFRALDFRLEAGARATLVGPSGVGKTTLLRLVAGLEAPSEGRILLGGEEASCAGKVVLPPWRRGIQLVFQDLGLWPTRSVLANVVDTRKAAGLPDATGRSRELLAALGLDGLHKRRPASLSGGEARRLAFARALAAEPKLLLLDEPFAHLDAASRDAGFALLEQVLADRDTAVLMVTHRDEEAARLGGASLALGEEVAA